MPHYKRQHYLPTAYLKYFAIDQAECSRDSWIWRFDGETHHPVRVVSQCAADYHYSKQNPAQAEAMFSPMESRYCHCVDKLKAGRALTSHDHGALLMTMFDFQLRNAIHKNSTGTEGIEAYQKRCNLFLREMLLGRKTGDVTSEEIRDHIWRHWGLKFVSNLPGHVFLTSDNPSVWITVNPGRPALHLVTLPITPTETAIAFDRRILEVVRDEIDVEDEQTLNLGQIENSAACVYASGQLPYEQLEIIQTHFDRKGPADCEIGKATWRLRIQGLSPEHYFSFTRLSPPLL